MRMRRGRGFTLIEVMVALAVLAIALAAVLKGISAHVGNAAYLRERTLAHWVALNKISEMQVKRDWPAPGAADGSSLMAGHEWRWTVTVQDTPDPSVRRLDVAVKGDAAAHEALTTVVGYLARPQGPAS